MLRTRLRRVWGFGWVSDKNNHGNESGMARSTFWESGVKKGGGRNFSPVTGDGRRWVGLVGREKREREREVRCAVCVFNEVNEIKIIKRVFIGRV